jgi:hypothetical protein
VEEVLERQVWVGKLQFCNAPSLMQKLLEHGCL